jgi:hypothetical protein
MDLDAGPGPSSNRGLAFMKIAHVFGLESGSLNRKYEYVGTVPM